MTCKWVTNSKSNKGSTRDIRDKIEFDVSSEGPSSGMIVPHPPRRAFEGVIVRDITFHSILWRFSDSEGDGQSDESDTDEKAAFIRNNNERNSSV